MLLKVGTFNMAAGLQPKLENLKDFLEQEDFTFLGLQEVDEKTTRYPYDTTEYLSKNLALNGYFSKAMDFSNGAYGLSLLVKAPILQQETVFFPTTGNEPRLFQHVLVEIKGQLVHLYNTHLSFETPEIRRQQMNFLKEHLQFPYLVTGDFNTDYSIQEWEDFKLPLEKVNGQPHFFATFKEDDPLMHTKAIDNLLFTKNFTRKDKQIIPTPLSDHHLLTSIFEM